MIVLRPHWSSQVLVVLDLVQAGIARLTRFLEIVFGQLIYGQRNSVIGSIRAGWPCHSQDRRWGMVSGRSLDH